MPIFYTTDSANDRLNIIVVLILGGVALLTSLSVTLIFLVTGQIIEAGFSLMSSITSGLIGYLARDITARIQKN